MTSQGVNSLAEKIVGITRMAFNGQVGFLETGTTASGLLHILAGKTDAFAGLGISPDEIPGLIIDTLRNQIPDKVIPDTVQGGFQLVFSKIGDVTHNWSIIVGSNGYIVTAFPVK
jgi:hypothetical protein